MSRELTTRHAPEAAPPNYNELERAEELADALERAVRIARRHRLDHVSLLIDGAEELLQLMRDGLRTAKALGASNGH